MVSRYYKGTPSEPGPTPETRRVPIKNRYRWKVVVSAEVAEMLKPYELFMDQAKQLWVQSVTRKKWRLPPGNYSIEVFVYPGMKFHPLTGERLE